MYILRRGKLLWTNKRQVALIQTLSTVIERVGKLPRFIDTAAHYFVGLEACRRIVTHTGVAIAGVVRGCRRTTALQFFKVTIISGHAPDSRTLYAVYSSAFQVSNASCIVLLLDRQCSVKGDKLAAATKQLTTSKTNESIAILIPSRPYKWLMLWSKSHVILKINLLGI